MTLKQRVGAIVGIEYLENENLTSYTTFKLNSVGDLIKVRSVDALKLLLPILYTEKAPYLVVGWGANQILAARVKEKVLHLEFPFDPDYMSTLREEYLLPASLGLNHLTSHASKFGLRGWEVFTGIPASLGGAIFMNAGTNLGEIGRIVRKVLLVTPRGEVREEVITEKSFSYRRNHFVKPGEVIIGAVVVPLGIDEAVRLQIREYLEYRKKTQPLTTKNCGCVFKNPMKELPAGKLIDLLQLKGVSAGDLRISPKHGNFMENSGNANWDQFTDLVNLINLEMDHFYGIQFELEVKIPYH